MRIDIGSFLMGSLGPDDHRTFTAHLVVCEACADEIAELAPVLSLLETVYPVDAENRVPSSLRQQVLSAINAAGSEAVLDSVRNLENRPAHAGLSTGSSLGSNATQEPESLRDATVIPFDSKTGNGSRSDRSGGVLRRFDRRLLAGAAALLLVGGSFAVIRRSSPDHGAKFDLVTLGSDPTDKALDASARIRTVHDTTVAEFDVVGTVPDEIYFAWFEDPEGKRISLGSFRGADGPVHFRGQTGIPRTNIVAIGASTKAGDKPVDRIRAELPRK